MAVDPKKVMTQSSTTTRMGPVRTPFAYAAWNPANRSGFASRAKAMTERPHRMYPRQMKGLRRPTRSERAPMSRVVTVAATALRATIQAMAVGSGAMALYRNTLKYMFSMVQAN